MTDLRLSGGQAVPRPLAGQIDEIDRRLGQLPAALFFHIPTGFPALDQAFGGGLAAQELMLIAGRQNVGKTIFALQIGRNIADWAQQHGHPLLPWVLSYEHDDWDLLTRLICMESLLCLRAAGRPESEALPYPLVNRTVREIKLVGGSGAGLLDRLFERLPPIGLQAFLSASRYMPNLMLSLGDRTHTTAQVIEEVMVHYRQRLGVYILPVIDYLQTIPPPVSLAARAAGDPDLVHGRNIAQLKDLAMRHFVPVIAVSAVADEALRAQRPVHLEDVVGSIQAQYTPDRAVVLNPDGACEEDGGRVSVLRLSLEKNRRGPSELEWRHVRRGAQFWIEPEGELVEEGRSFLKKRSGGAQEG